MATIKAAIALYDGVTNPLKSMNRAMNIVINSFESLQRTASNAVDTSAIKEAREELAKAETAFDGIEQSIREIDQQQQKVNRSISKGENAASRFWSKCKGAALALGGMFTANKILETSDALVSTNARLQNVLVQFDDNGTLVELEKKVMASAQRSRSAYMDTASAIAKMGMNASSSFGNLDEVIRFQELINKSFVIGGATAEEQKYAMIQLTQAMAAGALRGEELNSVLEGAPGIARAIEQYMGVAEGSIKQYAEQGLITAEVVKNAMFSAADDIESKFEAMPKTWAQIWIGMQNKALSIFAPILTKINQIGNSERFTKATDGIINGLAGIARVATVVFDFLVSGAAWVSDHWGMLEPIIYGIIAALLVYYGTLWLVQGALWAVHGAEFALSIVKGLLAAATMLATGAQWKLNGAMYACPLVWIILLVIAVIAIFYALVAAMNHAAETSVSATGLICGAFAVALAFIGNIFVALENIVIDLVELIMNAFIEVANFLTTVFENPVGACVRLFAWLGDTALGVLETILNAVDTVFGSDWSGLVQGWRDSLNGWVTNKFGQNVELREKVNLDSMRLERFEYGAAWDRGYAFGQGIEDKVKSFFDFSALDTLGAGGDPSNAFDLGNTLDGIYQNTGDTAGNTAAMRDALDLAEEDLEYMRDIAEREAINRYTTAQIKVEQYNTNYIDQNTDLDGIMDIWANDFAQKMDVSAEGVHA